MYSMRDCSFDISVYRSGCEHLMTSLFSLKAHSLENYRVSHILKARRAFLPGSIAFELTKPVRFLWNTFAALLSEFHQQNHFLIQCIPHNGEGEWSDSFLII